MVMKWRPCVVCGPTGNGWGTKRANAGFHTTSVLAPLPSIRPVIPRFHPGLTPLSLPNLHHLSMLLLN